MAISATYDALSRIALTEFGDIVVKAEIQYLSTGDPRNRSIYSNGLNQRVVPSPSATQPST